MNYLGHLFLSRNHPELMAGVFMGDHVKGTLKGIYPDEIELGIQFHRSVDAHVDAHTSQQLSVSRLPKHLRRYGGIACDVIYDYYLANHWHRFSEQNFAEFCQFSYQQILNHEHTLTESARRTILRMSEVKSLEGYTSKQYVERSLNFIAQRLKHSNPMTEIFAEFEQLDHELEQDFLAFLPQVDKFGQTWLADRLPSVARRS